MAATTGILLGSVWQKILTVVNNALVYLDTPAAELLHWSSSVQDIVEAGALAIFDFSSGRGGNESETKAVFIITTLLCGSVLERLSAVVQASDFQHCTVVFAISESVHAFAKHLDPSEGSVFGDLSHQLRKWMGNMYATVDIHHIPLFTAQVCPGLFITPAFSSFFPLLPSDAPRLQKFLRSLGDKRVFNGLNEIEQVSLPQNLQVKIKMFASGLNSLFEMLEVNEDCYGMGYMSKLIATELANMPSARVRRKAATSRGSIVLIDRTLDLVGPSGHSCDTLADRIVQLLPRLTQHTNDIAVDMSTICSNGSSTPETLAPGCLAHPQDPTAQALLNSMFTKRPKESSMDLVRQLIEAITRESLPVKTKLIPGKVSVDQLKMLAEQFRGHPKAFKSHSAMLQLVMAAVNALQHSNNSHMEHLQATEKGLMLNLSEQGFTSGVAELLNLIQRENKKRKLTLQDVLLLAVFVYSMIGGECYDSPAQEEEFKNTLVELLLSGQITSTREGFLGSSELSEKTVRRKIADAVEKLRGVGVARAELQQFGNVFQEASALKPACYQSLVKQIIDKVFSPEKPELVDIEFKSHGLKDYIKTGFSLFMTVSKPRPSDFPLLVLFVVGGVTCSEVRQITEAVTTYHPNTQVLVGSTRILNTQDLFEQLFCQDNLFPLLV